MVVGEVDWVFGGVDVGELATRGYSVGVCGSRGVEGCFAVWRIGGNMASDR